MHIFNLNTWEWKYCDFGANLVYLVRLCVYIYICEMFLKTLYLIMKICTPVLSRNKKWEIFGGEISTDDDLFVNPFMVSLSQSWTKLFLKPSSWVQLFLLIKYQHSVACCLWPFRHRSGGDHHGTLTGVFSHSSQPDVCSSVVIAHGL